MDAVRTSRPRALQWSVSVDGDPARRIMVESESHWDACNIASRVLGVSAAGLVAVLAQPELLTPGLRLLS